MTLLKKEKKKIFFLCTWGIFTSFAHLSCFVLKQKHPMSTVTVDKDGNRIITDVLISGYLRKEIEKKHKILIPYEIKQLCFDFWFINVCDQWDIKSSKQSNIQFDGKQIAKCNNNVFRSIYGCHCVSSGEFEWKLNLKKIGRLGICVGIVQNDKIDDFVVNCNYVTEGYGALWYSRNGCLLDKTLLFPKVTHGLEDVIKNICLKMKIDIDEKRLSYSIDEDEYKTVSYTLVNDKNKSFRLAVYFTKSHDVQEVELL